MKWHADYYNVGPAGIIDGNFAVYLLSCVIQKIQLLTGEYIIIFLIGKRIRSQLFGLTNVKFYLLN